MYNARASIRPPTALYPLAVFEQFEQLVLSYSLFPLSSSTAAPTTLEWFLLFCCGCRSAIIITVFRFVKEMFRTSKNMEMFCTARLHGGLAFRANSTIERANRIDSIACIKTGNWFHFSVDSKTHEGIVAKCNMSTWFVVLLAQARLTFDQQTVWTAASHLTKALKQRDATPGESTVNHVGHWTHC